MNLTISRDDRIRGSCQGPSKESDEISGETDANSHRDKALLGDCERRMAATSLQG